MEYTVKITDFEGPLDLLLHLIEKAKVDIKDIFVSEITEQYLFFIEDMKELNMDIASEFLAVAATLLLIKSRSLLPKPAPLDEDDPETQLIRQIEEYKLFKSASVRLSEFEQQAGKSYYKLPEEFAFEPPDIELEGIDLNGLTEAFLNLYNSRKEPEEATVREVIRDKYTVQNRIKHIRKMILSRSVIKFEELFEDNPTKTEMVCTFAAMLELLAGRVIAVEQKKVFGSILIKKAGEIS